MGIYDEKLKIGFPAQAKQAIPFIIAIIVLIGLVLLFNFLSELMKQQPIVASFSENPLEMAKGSTYTKLSVTVSNTLGKNAPNVQVEVRAEDTETLIVSPAKTDLGLIEKGNRRITEFIIRPNPAKTIRAGTYTLNIFVVMNGERFQEQVILEIKTT